MSEKRWLIPDVIDPAEKICVQLEIPNDLKHIAAFWGALGELGQAWNWEDGYVDGLTVAYLWREVIDDAAQSVRDGVSCDMPIDCEEVEDCLETSTIILAIEDFAGVNRSTLEEHDDLILANDHRLDDHADDIEILDTSDGNEYPDAPTGGDEACGSAFYIVSKLRDYIADIEASATTFLSIEEALIFYLESAFTIFFNPLAALITAFFGGSPPASVLTDYDAQLDDMRKILYCDGFSKENFTTTVRADITNGDAIADFIDSLGLGTWDMWTQLGALDTSQDCSSFICGTWCYRFDFTQGLDGWTISPYGQQTNGVGLETGHRDWDGGTYHDVEAYLDLTGKNATQMRVVGMFVNAYLDNSSIVWWGRPLGSGTGQIFEEHFIGWNAQNSPRDSVVDISDWTDIAMHMRAAAKVVGQYSGNPEAYIEFIELSGIGENPFGESECS